jgi:hypothetical protein
VLAAVIKILYVEREIAVDAGAHQPLADEAIPTLSWPPETFDPTSGDEDSLMGIGVSGTPVTKPTTSSKYLTICRTGTVTMMVNEVCCLLTFNPLKSKHVCFI